jgi:hypothetical protein
MRGKYKQEWRGCFRSGKAGAVQTGPLVVVTRSHWREKKNRHEHLPSVLEDENWHRRPLPEQGEPTRKKWDFDERQACRRKPHPRRSATARSRLGDAAELKNKAADVSAFGKMRGRWRSMPPLRLSVARPLQPDPLQGLVRPFRAAAVEVPPAWPYLPRLT